MKTLCITGTAHLALHAVAQQLFASGLAPAHPSPRGDGMDIAAWHQRVLAKHASGSTQLGRLWEQLAADIFMGNLESPVWGWTDPRSVDLLDFWQHFDPHLYFVLVCVSPRQALAHAIAANDSASPDAVLQHWYATHQAMLRFHLRHSDRSVLVSADDALAHGAQLIDTLSAQWALPLQFDSQPQSPSAPLADPVAHYLADQLLQGRSLEHSLQQEILASLTALSPDVPPVPTPIAADEVIAAYRHLLDRSQEAEQIAALVEERDALSAELGTIKEERGALLSQMHRTHEKLEILHHKEQQTAEQLNAAKSELSALTAARDALTKDKTTLTAELNDAREEGELLLTQLHQVQEELESLFLKEQQTGKQLASVKTELTALTAARDTLNKQVADLTKARDEQSKLANDRKVQIDALHKEKVALTSAHDALNKDKTDLTAELTDAREEGELLLTQLHQVQEELEHYFLEHQKLKHERQAQDERWQRMLQRTPDFCDYASVTARPAAQPATLNWQLDALETAGRLIPQLHCQTLLVDGNAGIRFSRTPGQKQPLLHWPADADVTDIVLAPADAAARSTLARLATSDVLLLNKLAGVFQHALSAPASLQLPSDFPAAELQTALAQLPQQLATLPPALRYDAVTLKNNQTNPDYEHLWFVLDNLSLGDQRWPQFEFRLSCANVGPRRFGTHPKLEFPQHIGQALLPGWFDESYDDHGAKLELRFALPDAMDVQVWSQLGDADHQFLRALIDALPGLLATLQASGAQVSRAWQDWFKLADDSRRILSLRAPVEEANPLQA